MVACGVRFRQLQKARETATLETFLSYSHHISYQVLTNLTCVALEAFVHTPTWIVYLNHSRGTTTKVAIPHFEYREKYKCRLKGMSVAFARIMTIRTSRINCRRKPSIKRCSSA